MVISLGVSGSYWNSGVLLLSGWKNVGGVSSLELGVLICLLGAGGGGWFLDKNCLGLYSFCNLQDINKMYFHFLNGPIPTSVTWYLGEEALSYYSLGCRKVTLVYVTFVGVTCHQILSFCLLRVIWTWYTLFVWRNKLVSVIIYFPLGWSLISNSCNRELLR